MPQLQLGTKTKLSSAVKIVLLLGVPAVALAAAALGVARFGGSPGTLLTASSVNSPAGTTMHTLVINRNGTGWGIVQVYNQSLANQATNDPGALNNYCPGDGGIGYTYPCSFSYPQGTVLTLSATAQPPTGGSTFGGWTGCSTSTSTMCTVVLNADTKVGATFTSPTPYYTLVVNGLGAGSGTVKVADRSMVTDSVATCTVSSNHGCNYVYPSGTIVDVTASPATGSTFGSWSGPCAGTKTCTITITGNTLINATFSAAMYTINVVKPGPGTGTVSIASSNSSSVVSCGPNTPSCSYQYAAGTQLTFTGTQTPGFGSVVWGFPCVGSTQTTCTYTVSGPATVTAKFNPPPPLTTAYNFTINATKNTSVIQELEGSATKGCAPGGIPDSFSFTVQSPTAAGGTVSPAKGSALCGGTDSLSAMVTYTPKVGYTGADSFTYYFSNPTAGSMGTASIVIR